MKSVSFLRSIAITWVSLLCLLTPAKGQDIIVDNLDPAFSILNGFWNTGAFGSPYDANYHWIGTTSFNGGSGEVEWRPNLPQSGSYAVFVWYVSGANRANDAPFTIHHANGSTPVIINQQNDGETWVSLGTYSFDAGTTGSVSLSNDANPSVVIADAVRFVRSGPAVELTMDVSPAATGATAPAIGGPYIYSLGQLVSISATPVPGFVFDQWLTSAGSTPTNPTSPQTTVSMDQSKTLTATFTAAPPVDLIMNIYPPGSGTTSPVVGGPYSYPVNSTVPLSATAASGYQFDHWQVSGGLPPDSATANLTAITLDQSKTVTAVFEESMPNTSFRGFWADAFREGYKSKSQIDTLIARALAGNYNAILPEVLAYQDNVGNGHGAYWDSAIIPRASDIIGGFDPLAYLVQEAHAVGLEVHCWLVSFRVSTSWPPSGNSIVANHPEWIMVPRANIGGGPATVGGRYTLDPGSPDVQNYLANIVRELSTNYAIDGIHWDYIRYIETDAGYPSDVNYANSSLARFQRITGRTDTPSVSDSQWNDFRRRTITEFVRRMMWETATANNPRQPLRHTAALITWGNAPSSFTSSSAYRLFQNWRHWMQAGYLDASIPMIYYDENLSSRDLWYRNWVNRALDWRYNRHVFTGPGIYLNTMANSVTQMQYALDAGADGLCTFSYGVTDSDSGTLNSTWYPYVAENLFTEPADPPAMPWRNPHTAVDGAIYGRVTDGSTGQPIDDALIWVNDAYSGINTDGNGYFILTQLPAAGLGTTYEIAASNPGYTDVLRPLVLVEPAGFTEANLALGDWLPGDQDVDGDVDHADFVKYLQATTGPGMATIPAGGDLFDFDQDNDVDTRDYQVLQQAAGP